MWAWYSYNKENKMSKIKELIKNKNFLDQLKQAARFTSKTARESTLLILREKNEIIVKELSRGKSRHTIEGHFIRPGLIVEGHLHFHPFEGPVIIPSEDDLRLLVWKSDKEEYEEPDFKWIIIAQVQGKKIFLLYIEPVQRIAESEILNWEEETENLQETVFQENLQKQIQKEINEKLVSYGFKIEFKIIHL